ncbi:unnamed protein product [Adineta steineri]|uniref:Cilia- and flagella-associated protein 157 n=3 Tax=Adineta steineri TaxID=433720 RepID=A0A814PNJ4_9BILA|nr:unnamed protein product [Adineta steineri]
MVARVNDLSSEFRRVSKMQVVQTTRQIILENVRLNNQMAIIESDYNNVEIENGKIREQKKSKSLELSLLDERERMMAKKNRKTYQLIEKLTEECSAHEQFIATLDEKIASFDYTQQLIDELEEVNTNTDARRYQIYEENESLRRTIAQRKETLSQCEHDMEKAKYPIEKTIQALNDVLQDSSDTSNTGRTIDTRLGAFENIFRLLNVATQLGIGPNLKELAVKNEDDLLATTIDYDNLPSPAQPLGSLKKLKTKSVAIQTNISNRNPVPYHIQTDVSAVRPKSLPFRKRRPSLLSTSALVQSSFAFLFLSLINPYIFIFLIVYLIKACGKDKGKGKKKKAPAVPEYIPDIKLNENDKKFYTTQIELLEKQFERYQQRCDELKARQQAELDQVKTLEQDFEMLKYAKKQVELKEEEIADLKDRLVGLGQAKELEKDMLQKQLNDLKNEINDLRERYDAENSELRNQVSDLEIFRAKQDTYLSQRQRQQDTFQFQEEDHIRKLESIKTKDQVDRDRLKRDMIQKMNHVASEFRRASNKQMAETTKRTINENARIEQTVDDMKDVTTRVENENEHIHDGNNQVEMGIQTLKNKEQHHAFQHATSAEIIQLLANMLNNQEQIIIKKQEEVARMDTAERRMEELRSSIFNNEKNYPTLRQENKSYQEELYELDQLIAEKTKDKTILLSNLRRSVGLITDTLKIREEEKGALAPSGQPQNFIAPEKSGNLFKELHEILTCTEEIDLDEQPQASSNTEVNRPTLNVR